MLYAKSVQSIENFNYIRTVDKETKFKVDLIENVYYLYLYIIRDILDKGDKDESDSIRMRAIV
jgi:hypothetical protein